MCLLMNGWTVWSDWLRTGSLIDILFLLVTNLGNLGVNRHSLGLQIDESKGRRKQALYAGGVSGKEPACQCRRQRRCRFNP